VESSDRPEPAQAAAITASQPVEAPKSEVKPEVKSEVALPPPATLEIAALPATAAIAPASATRTIQQQVVEATGMADLVTAIGTGREAANKPDNPATGPGEAGDTGKTASASPDKEDNLVALVLARSEITSLSDLNNKNIAIEEKQSASSGRVSAALMAAGAAEVQFSEAKAGAIDRLISGEVPAAVLTLASREAAEWFPDIAGFRTFRVPLKERL
jgi:ABC-type phosphate/phosphonate transport system substrate-binding protein